MHQRSLQFLLAASFAVWCSAVHGLALPSTAHTAQIARAPQSAAVGRCIERVAANADLECQLDQAPPTQQRFHTPDLLGLDDEPEDEDLGAVDGEIELYGPRQVALCHVAADSAPKLTAYAQLERPPRA